nr:type IV secretory system conjugative DNA transfer family protein [Escherichia coli]
MFLDEFPSIGYMPIIKKGSGILQVSNLNC